MRLYDMVQRLAYVVDATLDLRNQARARADSLRAGDALARRLSRYADQLEAFRTGLVSTSEAGRMAGEEKLREKLVSLYGTVNGYEGRPTESQLEAADVLTGELEAAAARFATLTATEPAAVNAELERRKLPAVKLLSREEWERR